MCIYRAQQKTQVAVFKTVDHEPSATSDEPKLDVLKTTKATKLKAPKAKSTQAKKAVKEVVDTDDDEDDTEKDDDSDSDGAAETSTDQFAAQHVADEQDSNDHSADPQYDTEAPNAKEQAGKRSEASPAQIQRLELLVTSLAHQVCH